MLFFINLEIHCCILKLTLASFIAKLLLGNLLKEGTPISVNPLVIWAWAGLLINAINSIPAGELDGGRISFAIWGRKVCNLKLNILLEIHFYMANKLANTLETPKLLLNFKIWRVKNC